MRDELVPCSFCHKPPDDMKLFHIDSKHDICSSCNEIYGHAVRVAVNNIQKMHDYSVKNRTRLLGLIVSKPAPEHWGPEGAAIREEIIKSLEQE